MRPRNEIITRRITINSLRARIDPQSRLQAQSSNGLEKLPLCLAQRCASASANKLWGGIMQPGLAHNYFCAVRHDAAIE